MPRSPVDPTVLDDARGLGAEAPVNSIVAPPSDDEDDPKLVAALEEANPRAKLFELCASLLLLPPTLDVRKDEGATRGTVTMTVARRDGATFTSGPCTAASRRVAELLAARALLAALTAGSTDAPRGTLIDADEEAALRTQNPKGRLLELCTRAQWTPPIFDVGAIANGFGGTARLTVGGATLTAKARTARQAKLVEQALAAELLAQAEGLAERTEPPVGARDNPRERLDELRLEDVASIRHRLPECPKKRRPRPRSSNGSSIDVESIQDAAR